MQVNLCKGLIVEDYKLSEHFSFYELTTTTHSEYINTNRIDAQKQVKNLKYTAGALEEVRKVLGEALTVTSGFRTPKLNSSVGGSKTSKHQLGLCADFKPTKMSVKDAFALLVKNKENLHSVRKVIVEGKGASAWIHMQAKVLANEELEFYASEDTKNFVKVS